MRDFFLTDEDRAFRAEIRDFLARELAPRAAQIERDEDWEAVKEVVRALGSAGYMKLMFRDLYSGPLEAPRPHPRDHALRGGRLSQLRLRDHHRHGAVLRLPAARPRPPGDPRALPHADPRGHRHRLDLHDRAERRLRQRRHGDPHPPRRPANG